MAVLIARHGERLDYAERGAGRLWAQTAGRPWDPPLTRNGFLQGAALGRAIVAHLKRLDLPPLTRIFSSPFVRCVQTSAMVAEAAGVASICVETSLVENHCESFYRSWAVPGADSAWGGPPHCRCGVPVNVEDLRPLARGPARGLLPPADADELQALTVPRDASYVPFLFPEDWKYSWDSFETDWKLAMRMRSFFDHIANKHAGESIVLISHGGPVMSLFKSVVPKGPRPVPGYCGLYLLRRDGRPDGPWVAPLVADAAHMAEVDAPTVGLNDAAERPDEGPGDEGQPASRPPSPPPSHEAITKYSWSDGGQQVCIDVELDGSDALPDDALNVASDAKSVLLEVDVPAAGRKRRLELRKLAGEIRGVRLVRAKGSCTVQLQLTKADPAPWPSLH